MNDLAWNGDGSTGTFLSINTGFETLAAADGDVADVDMSSGAGTATLLFGKLYNGMPSQYRALGDQRFFVSPGLASSFMTDYATRATAGGDDVMLNGMLGVRYFGVPIVVDRHLDNTKAYMTPASNFVFGVHRDVTQELDWNPRKRQVELTVSIRFDYQYKFGGVISRGESIVSALQ